MEYVIIYLLALIIGFRTTTLYSAKMTKQLCKKDKLKLISYMQCVKKDLIRNRLFYLFAIGILIVLLQHQHISWLAQLNTRPLRIIWALYLACTATTITIIQINYANKMAASGLPQTYIHKSYKLSAMSCCYILAVVSIFFGYLNP